MTAAHNAHSFPPSIHPSLASALEAKGYKNLTPVQLEMASQRYIEADGMAQRRVVDLV